MDERPEQESQLGFLVDLYTIVEPISHTHNDQDLEEIYSRVLSKLQQLDRSKLQSQVSKLYTKRLNGEILEMAEFNVAFCLEAINEYAAEFGVDENNEVLKLLESEEEKFFEKFDKLHGGRIDEILNDLDFDNIEQRNSLRNKAIRLFRNMITSDIKLNDGKPFNEVDDALIKLRQKIIPYHQNRPRNE